MKRIAPFLLIALAAALFLGAMATDDAAALGYRALYSLGAPFMFVYGLVAIWSVKYRKPSRWSSVVALGAAVLLGGVWILRGFGLVVVMSAKNVGYVLFAFAVVDVLVGFWIARSASHPQEQL